MNCLTVRSVTVFTNNVFSRLDVENEVVFAEEVYSAVHKLAREKGFNVFSWRISFSGLDMGLAKFIPDSFLRDKLVSVGYLRKIDPENIVNLVESGFYVPLLHVGDGGFDRFKSYSMIIHELSRLNPLYATRVSIGFHDEFFQTPYFPDSSSRGTRSIGLSFIYPRCLEGRDSSTLSRSFERVFATMNTFAREIEDLINVKVLIDYSLSPWMDDSVAEILERMGFSLLEPGALHGISVLNEQILKHMDRGRAVGFNEVMLPYAEDNVLKLYGEKGSIHATDFLLFASTCVAGVDMVVVPEDKPKLAGLIADAEALAKIKRRALSLRAIPVPHKPGDKLVLGKFGNVAVIPY